jgi:hypothetical protein
MTAFSLRAVVTAKRSAKERECRAFILDADITASKLFEIIEMGSPARTVSIKYSAYF